MEAVDVLPAAPGGPRIAKPQAPPVSELPSKPQGLTVKSEPSKTKKAPKTVVTVKLSRSDRLWEDHYAQIVAFVEQNKRIPVVGDFHDGKRFDAWLEHYRRVGGTYRKMLTLPRQQMLAAIPGWEFSEEGYKRGRVLIPQPTV